MPNANWSFFCLPGLALVLLTLGPTAAVADAGDPGVAFVSTLNGDVSVQRGDSGDVVAAGINAPLLVGDSVWTGSNGRAEIQFDYGHVVRVGPDAQIRFAALGSSDDTVQLAAGTVGVGVLHPTDQYTQVETPSVTVRPRTDGFYRVSVDSNGTTKITVRSGSASILLPQGTRGLSAGSTMYVWGPADQPSYRYVHPISRDAFERWNDDRDAAFVRSNAYRYAAPGIPGLYALDAYGQWDNDPDYGNEWIPNVPADWSPYSTGRWVSEPYYGWTWVDNEPWGYAPSHYGRWHRDGRRNRWAWTPGARTQPVAHWAPALVAFIGFGGGGLSIAVVNSIAWVPLAPREQPHPWWGAGQRNYAASNPGNVRTVYRNAQYTTAVRSLPRESFGNGAYQRTAPVAAVNLTRAVVMRGAVPVVPQAQALRYTQRAPVAAPARPAEAFHAFTAATPRPPQTFVQQRAQAVAVVNHAPPPAIVAPAPKNPAFAQPPHQGPPNATAPGRQAPAFTRPEGQIPPVAGATPRREPPAFAQPQHEAPPVAAPTAHQPPAFAQPERGTPPAGIATPRREPPAFAQPQRQGPPVVAPTAHHPPAFAPPQRQAPPVVAPPVVAPTIRQAPAFAQPQRQTPPVVTPAVRQAPPVVAPPVRQPPAFAPPRQAPAPARPTAAPPKDAATAAPERPAAGEPHRPGQ
jgi:hypothetical protein